MVLRFHHLVHSAGGDFALAPFPYPVYGKYLYPGRTECRPQYPRPNDPLIIYMTILQIGILLLETALRFYFSFITAWLGQTVVKDLRVAVYKRVLSLNLSQYDKTPIGTLTTRTINDIEAINDIFSEGLIPDRF